VTRGFWRASLREARRQPWQIALGCLGIALGVAVVCAIDITEASARRAFDRATDSVVGRATHQVIGGPRGLDEALYVELRRAFPAHAAAPVIEATLEIAAGDRPSVRLLGIDPIAEAPFRDYWRGAARLPAEGLLRLMIEPRTALASRAAAARLEVAPGDTLPCIAGAEIAPLEILGLLDAQGDQSALGGTELLVADIATAQELLRRFGRITRIDLILPEGAAPAIEAWLGARDPSAALVPSESRGASVQAMTRAFHSNLSALSLLALLVGVFLIYNSQTFMVLRRREQFGLMRALGVGRGQLARVVLAEAACQGAAGTAAGITAGVLLAGALLGLVTRTINDLYYPLSVGATSIDAALLAKAAALGLGATLIAALAPTWEAARVAPRAAMSRAEVERRAGDLARHGLLAGILCLVAGVTLLLASARSLAAGFGGLFLIIIGAVLATPALTIGVIDLLLAATRRLPRAVTLRLALRGVVASLSRTAVAVAALMLAVATTIGIGVMVASFRASVADWLGAVLQADYYVTAAGGSDGFASAPFPREIVEALGRTAGVRGVSHVRRTRIESHTGVESLAVYGMTEEARRGFRFRAVGDRETFWRAFESDDVVMVSESYAFHHGLARGDALALRTDRGTRRFRIEAIYQDYAADRGIIAMARRVYDRYWDDDAVTGLGVYAAPGFDRADLRRRLEALGAGEHRFEIVANREIRAASLAVFDRTFRITEVLRLLAGLIAMLGIFSALLAIQLERTRELGVLKALGVTPAGLRTLVLGQTAAIGVIAGVLAVPVGIAMAVLLVYVINRRSFGWTMDLHLEAAWIAGAVAVALGAALAAGVYPAARMARIEPAAALRAE
jgi:putative ABC transport system permease protein